MSVVTLADLTKSPERKVFEAAVAAARADSVFSAVFKPIRTGETPTFSEFLNYGTYTLGIQPASVKAEDHPSKRSTSLLALWFSFYLPAEPRDEDSKLYGLDILSRLRALYWGQTYDDPSHPGIHMNFATTSIRQMQAHVGADGATRILTFEVTFELDVNPVANDFATG